MVEGLAIPNFDFQLLALIAAETYQPEAKVRTDETYCYPAQDETCKK